MRVHFCDLCNESVPQGDLDAGKAVIRNGRVICSTCEGAMSAGEDKGAEPAPVVPPGGPQTPARISPTELPARPPKQAAAGAGLALAMALIALLACIGGGVYFFDRVEGNRAALRGQLAETRRLIARSSERTDERLTRGVEDLSSQSESLAGQIGVFGARLDEASRHQFEAMEVLREDVSRLAERLRELDALVGAVERHEQELSKVGDTVAGLHAEVLLLGDRILAAAQLEATTPPETARIDEQNPSWWPLVARLASQSSDIRWQTIQDLGDTGDPAVAEHVVPMLKDPDIFVRMASARILEELRAVSAIPALIDALEDPEASVREAAAVALRSISGRDLRFDPDAKEAERARQIKAWRDWWKRAERDLLGQG
jgi:hypothetical protein